MNFHIYHVLPLDDSFQQAKYVFTPLTHESEYACTVTENLSSPKSVAVGCVDYLHILLQK